MDLHELPIVLASHSPSRRLLFEQVGLSFEVMVSGADETVEPNLSPEETVEILSKRKADAVSARCPEKAVVAADSMVSLGSRLLGKPDGPEGAREMLHMLSGRTHRLVTGVCIQYRGKEKLFHCVTEVEFFPLTDAEIDEYVASGESIGKAGSYGIEGRGIQLIRSIHGDYANIVGIPIGQVVRELRRIVR